MAKLSEATQSQVNAMIDVAEEIIAGQRTFDRAAQAVTDSLYSSFRDTCKLARIFVSTPYRSLPTAMASWVHDLAAAKGAATGLTPDTQVMALAGSSGTRPQWNGRIRSEGHVGIPLISQDFINAIPMMARLIGSLGRDLSWLDTKDAGQLIKAMSRLSGRFYVPDASRTTDAHGRKVISDQAFVAENGITTVFGVASSSVMSSGALMALLVFSDETVPETQVDLFQHVLSRLRSAAASMMAADKLFAV
jgi:hypothetical protein